jgi:Zn-dependent M28 family amino/carboxypeptidase
LPSAAGPDFDPARAWAILLAQCRRGPRSPGSQAHRWTRQLIVEQLGLHAEEVIEQHWPQRIRRGAGAGRTVGLTNIIGVFPGAADTGDAAPRAAVLLGTHWDTRPIADLDPDESRRREPAPGASDGASGVAVLLELARVLRAERPPATVAVAFWDGEDLGEHCYGSRVFARAVRRRSGARRRPERAVVIDMIGGRALRCSTETGSRAVAPELWAGLHACAAELGLERHFGGPPVRVTDDHVALSCAGIPSVLLIDWSYRHRHTTSDTPEQCSPDSLAAVGRVLHRYVRRQPIRR